MPFPFALSRTILVSLIVITNVVSLALSATAFHEKTGGVFQSLAFCLDILGLLTVIGCHCHRCTSRDEETSNTRSLGMFGVCGLLALAISLTVHARQDGGMGGCGDFVNARHPCVHAGVQLGMAYIGPVFALIGFFISWIDKFPGAVKVTSRYPITKAPSSHFAAYGHDLDEKYMHPPAKVLSKWKKSEWTDVPLNC